MKKNVTIKEYLGMKRIRQVEVSKAIGASPALVNKVLNGWMKLPKKYEAKMSGLLGISEEELRSNKVKYPAPDNDDHFYAKLDIAIVALEKIVNSERRGYVISCPEIARMAIQEINNG